MGRSRAARAAAVTVAALVLVGCGGESAEEDRPAVEKTATEDVCRHDTASLVPAMEAAVPADATVRLSADIRGAGADVSMEGVVAYTPEGAEMEMAYRDARDSFTLVLVDDRVFISDPERGGDELRELTASDPGGAALRSLAEGVDITSEFVSWEAGLTDVEARGEAEIDGVTTCRYALRVDAAKAAEAEGDPLPTGMPATIVYTVHLAEDDLMRRVTFDIGGLTGRIDTTAWNEPVEIATPAP